MITRERYKEMMILMVGVINWIIARYNRMQYNTNIVKYSRYVRAFTMEDQVTKRHAEKN